MVKLKSPEQIQIMAQGGKILAKILKQLAKACKPGVRTKELDELAQQLVFSYSNDFPEAEIRPAFLYYQSGKGDEPYPAGLCVSINEEIVHGLPSDRVLRNGDVVSLDYGLVFHGLNLDSALTVGVGRISKEARRLIRVTEKSLELGIKQMWPGKTLGDIGFAIQTYVESNNMGVVRDLVGHGVGERLQEDPQVPNYGNPGKGMILEKGMVLAIEPMVTLGDFDVIGCLDGFTFKTCDDSLAAHFEHSVAVTDRGPLILTR